MILIIKLLLKMRSYISKMEISYCRVQPNHLTSRTAIEAECAVPVLVYFYILCNNKNYKKASGFLKAEPLSSYFEDRKGYREG